MNKIRLIPFLILFFACKSKHHLINPEVIQSKAKKIVSTGYFHNVNDTAEIIKSKKDSGAQLIEHFNKNGKIIKSASSGLGHYFTDYKYSKKGDLIEKTSYNKDSVINYRQTFHYEENRISQKTHRPKKELSNELIFQYNKKQIAP